MANQTKTNWNSPDYFRILDEANNSTGSIITNQSLQYQIDVNRNDTVKSGYETGSNFMLLLEDFGEYFYNYNGSGNIGNNNSVGFEFQTNCSITNSTCVTEVATGKKIHQSYYLKRKILFHPIHTNHIILRIQSISTRIIKANRMNVPYLPTGNCNLEYQVTITIIKTFIDHITLLFQ